MSLHDTSHSSTTLQPTSSTAILPLPDTVRAWLALLAIALLACFIRSYPVFDNSYPSGSDYGQIITFGQQFLTLNHLPETVPNFQLGTTNWATMPGTPLIFALLADIASRPLLDIIPFVLFFALTEIAGVYLLVWRIWRRLDMALVAALIVAVLPSYPDMMGWSGYSNIIGLSLIPFVFIAWLDYWDHPNLRNLIITVLIVCGTLMVHHVTTPWMGITLTLFAGIQLLLEPARSFKKLLPLGIVGVAVGFPIVWRTLEQYLTTDLTGVLANAGDRYAPTRIQWGMWTTILEPITLVLLLGGFIYFMRQQNISRPARLLLGSYTLVSLVFALGWVFGIAFYYTRALYFFSLPVALGAASLLHFWPMVPLRALVISVLAVFFGFTSITRGHDVADYYHVLSPDVIEGLAWLEEHSEPDDVVVMGTMIGFQASHLIDRPLLVALTADLVGNPQELAYSQDAVSVMIGLYNMDQVIDDRQVRFVVVKSEIPDIPEPPRTLLAMNANPRMELIYQNDDLQIYEVQD